MWSTLNLSGTIPLAGGGGGTCAMGFLWRNLWNRLTIESYHGFNPGRIIKSVLFNVMFLQNCSILPIYSMDCTSL